MRRERKREREWRRREKSGGSQWRRECSDDIFAENLRLLFGLKGRENVREKGGGKRELI